MIQRFEQRNYTHQINLDIGFTLDYREVMDSKFYEIPELRQKSGVFRNRGHAGQILADMLHAWKDGKAPVLAVPSGGLPVAVREE